MNGAGDKEPPVVMWNSKILRCFRGINKSCLPVKYYNQKKVWMTGNILDSVLRDFNRKMRSEGRSILLLLDNAGCHPAQLIDKYSNILIVFLPLNTISKLQPLD